MEKISKETILNMLEAWIKQRPGLEFGNYGEASSYRAELRQIAKDKHDAETLLRAVALRSSITADDLIAAFPRAYSGRLRLQEDPKKPGRYVLDYCTGQYWPTEYRKAACAVLASCLWDWFRDGCMPAKQYVAGDGVKFSSEKEAREYCAEMHRTQNCVLSIEERYNGMSAGDFIRKSFRREFGRSIQQRWFD